MGHFGDAAGKETSRGSPAPKKGNEEGRFRLLQTIDRRLQSLASPRCNPLQWRSKPTHQSVGCQPFLKLADPDRRRSIGKLMVRITYADAITAQEGDILIAQNEESARLSLEASLRVHLVDYFPLRMYGIG